MRKCFHAEIAERNAEIAEKKIKNLGIRFSAISAFLCAISA